MEYHHHGDALVPRQQRFGQYTRSLMKGLGIPVENRYGLRPARVPGTKTARALVHCAGPGHAGLAPGRHDLQLPHAPAALRGDDRRRDGPSTCWPGSRSTCPGRIRSRRRGTGSSTRSSGCRRAATGRAMCWWPTPRSSARCSAATRAWSASGRTSPRPHDAGRERIHDRRYGDACSSSTTSRAESCARGPLRTRRPTSCFRIDDRKAGRELMRRVERRRDLGREPDEPVGRHLGQRRAHLPRAQGARRAAGLARQLRLGVPAGDGRAREGAGRHRREQPRALGTAARDAGRPRRARRGLAGSRSGSRRRSSAPARRTGSCRGSRRSGARTATRCPPRRSRSGSGTASAIRPSKGAAFPEPIPRNSP